MITLEVPTYIIWQSLYLTHKTDVSVQGCSNSITNVEDFYSLALSLQNDRHATKSSLQNMSCQFDDIDFLKLCCTVTINIAADGFLNFIKTPTNQIFDSQFCNPYDIIQHCMTD